MKAKIIASLVSMIMGMMSPELLKTFADKILDFIEDYVIGSKSEIDDRIVLPICDMIRKTFDIPDNDE